MYGNLLAEIARKNLRKKDIAKEAEIQVFAFSKKLNGKKDFTVEEADRIHDLFFPELSLHYLFAWDGDREKERQ